MANGIDIIFDTGDFLRSLNVLDKKVIGAAKKGRAAVGDELLRLSQSEVPHDEGTLANTGVSEPDGEDHIVGYNTPYVAKLHEHPEYAFQKGRKGKYLEDPIKQNLKPFGTIFGMEIQKELK